MIQYTFKIFKAIVYTIRPYAVLGACLLVLAAFNPEGDEWNEMISLVMATFFGSAYCFLLNDIFDRKKDLLNDKRRPLATGELPVSIALFMVVLFALVFITSSWFLGMLPFLLSFVFIGIRSIYSLVNVKTGLMANVIVAFVVSGTQWGVALIKPDEVLWASSVFLFFYTIPREILLDWLDIKGDKAYGKRSAPINYSLKAVMGIIVLSLAFASLSIIAIVYLDLSSKPSVLLATVTFFSTWLSFSPFFKKPSHRSALLSVRWSHVTFVLLIFTLISR